MSSLLPILLGCVMHAAASGPPYYERPAEPAVDEALLSEQLGAGNADERWWLERVALYTNLGELDSVADLIRSLTQAWPAQPVFREAQMILESGRGHHDLAVEIGDGILADYPNYPTIRANLARVHMSRGDVIEALNLMLGAVEMGPVRVQDWEFLIKALARADRDAARTMERLERKAADNPGMEGLKYLQVVLYTRFGRYDKARDILVAHPKLATQPDLQRFVADVNLAFPPSPNPETEPPLAKESAQ